MNSQVFVKCSLLRKEGARKWQSLPAGVLWCSRSGTDSWIARKALSDFPEFTQHNCDGSQGFVLHVTLHYSEACLYF